jgi:glycerol kinase
VAGTAGRPEAGVSDGLLLGIDEGTTAVKAALFDPEDLREVAAARRPVPLAHPAPGRVEQDPLLIEEAVVEAVAEVLARAPGGRVLGAGLDHQGESVLAWEAGSVRPLTPVVVWQDKRQLDLLAGIDPAAVSRSGLPLDPYFSAGRMAWLLEHDAAVAAARRRGTLRLGTVDAFLAERLGGRFATDLSTASRTQLLAVGARDWDEELMELFGLDRELLPVVEPTYGALGELRSERWPAPLPLTAQLVDQQAALAGSGAVEPGELKATYGTGVFVLGPCARPISGGRLLPTVAWAGPEPAEICHAFDGGVFAAGALLDWLALELGLARDAAELAAAAASVPDAAGVLMLPALSGLGAPWWRARARGLIAGLHGGVRPAHLARAALEGIAWRVADIVEEAAALAPAGVLRVDGGLTRQEELLRIQADALGLPLEVRGPDQTALGAAMLAGVGAGVFGDPVAAARRAPRGRIVEPAAPGSTRAAARERWRAFVSATAAFEDL